MIVGEITGDQVLMASITVTDRQILGALATEDRNNAANIAAILDQSRPYINTRLAVLAHKGYVDHVGPAPNSGLYELTPDGREKATLPAEFGQSVS